MSNKKVASEIAVGVILLLAIVIGGIFWMQGKIDQTQIIQKESGADQLK